MLNYSRTAKIDDLIADIQALPDSTAEVDTEYVTAAKALAVSRLEKSRSIANGAHCNFRVNVIGAIKAEQFEFQIAAREIK